VIGRYTANLDRRYYYTDHLGSTRAVVDGSGTAQETRDYYPYGLRMPDRTLAEASSAKEDYTGHERDAETSLHYAGARYYMSALGRWNAVDPILAEKTPLELVALHGGRLHGYSPYNYVYNNPTALTDPDGELPIFGAAIGGAVGAVAGAAVEGLKQYNKGEYNGRALLRAGGKGAVVGAVAGATGGASLALSTGAVATANAAVGAVDRATDGDSQTSAGNVSDVVTDLAVGAAGGGTGRMLGGMADDAASSVLQKVSGATGSTSTRVAQNTGAAVAGETASTLTSLTTKDGLVPGMTSLQPARDLERAFGDPDDK